MAAVCAGRSASAQDTPRVEPSIWLGAAGALVVTPRLELQLGTQLRSELVPDAETALLTIVSGGLKIADPVKLTLAYRSSLSLVGSSPAHRFAVDLSGRADRGELRFAVRQRYTLGAGGASLQHLLRTRGGVQWRRAGVMPYCELEPYLSVGSGLGLERVRYTLGARVQTDGPAWSAYVHVEDHQGGDVRVIFGLDVVRTAALRGG